MIRRAFTYPHIKDSSSPDINSTSYSYSAIKSNAIKVSNRHERTSTNMTFDPPRIHFNIGRHPCKANSVRNLNKRLDLGGFYEKRDGVGLLPNNRWTPSIQDRASEDTQKTPCAAKKDCGEGLKYPLSGEPRNSFSMNHMNSMGLILDADREDQMILPWKELENDLQNPTNQDPNSIVSNSSTNFFHLGLASVPSTPSLALAKNHVPPEGSRPVDSNLPTFSWLEAQTLLGPDTAKISIEGLSISEDTSKASRSVAASYTYSDKSKAIVSTTTRHKHWTGEEDKILRNAMAYEKDNATNWSDVSMKFFHSTRSPTQCKNRWKNHLQPGIIRGRWDHFEDQIILKMILQQYMWKDIASRLPGRTGESIRERYVNHLDPTLKKSKWIKEEDDILFETQRRVGNKWSEIRKLLPGRSDNSIKNRYHNRMKTYFRKIQKCKKEKTRKKPFKASVKAMKKEDAGILNLIARPSTSFGLEDFTGAVIGI